MRFVALRLLFPLFFAVVAGCGGSDGDLASVKGKVTLDGQPLDGATVEFQPSVAGGSPSYGRTDASGAYALMFTHDKRGATPGEHTVRLTKRLTTEGPAGEIQTETLPAKFNSKTELKATVTEGRNTIDFDLTSDGGGPGQ